MIGGLVAGVALVVAIVCTRALTRRRWQDVADQLGAELPPTFSVDDPYLSGFRDGVWFMISRRNRGCFVNLKGHRFINLELSRETVASRLTRDIQTGDAEFDYAVRITGDESLALALMDDLTRALVMREVVEGRVVLRGGQLRLRGLQLSVLAAALPGMIELARRLDCEREQIPARLATNATSDLLAPVRLQNLAQLIERYPDEDATRMAAVTALNDGEPAVRLEAAVFCGDEKALCALAEEATAEDGLRVRAVDELSRPEWAERVAPVLEGLLWSDSEPLRRSAVASLGRLRWQPAVTSLVEMIPTADGPLTETIASALGLIGRGPDAPNPLFDEDRPLDAGTFVERTEYYLTRREVAVDTAQAPLLELLEHPNPKVVAASAEALGAIGSVAAVERLQRVAASRGGAGRAAAEAVRRIQRRLPAAEHGQLSLASSGTVAGGLSVADHERGGVSLEEGR